MADQIKTASRSFPEGWQAERELVGLDSAPPSNANEDAIFRRRLPPSQYRSLGGYLDYSDWSERERFMELDRALQRQAQGEPNDIETQASDDPPLPIPAGRPMVRESQESGKTLTTDNVHLEWKIAGKINVFVKSPDGWTTGPFRRL